MAAVKLEVSCLLRYTSQYRKTWTFTLTRASHLLHQYVFVNILYRCIFVNAYPFDLPFEMKVTKELHLLSLGQRVCILLYAYEI